MTMFETFLAGGRKVLTGEEQRRLPLPGTRVHVAGLHTHQISKITSVPIYFSVEKSEPSQDSTVGEYESQLLSC